MPLTPAGGRPLWPAAWVAAAPAIAIATAFMLLFIDKPFTVDDPTFLLMARHMLDDPLHPTAFDFVFHGAWMRLSESVTGPLMPVLLLPSILHGGAEWLAHAAMLPVFALGLASTSALALRLGVSTRGARWAAMLTCTSPAVLACSTTSMPDVPAMTFAALGVERLLAFRDERRWTAAAVAAAAMALAVLARVHVIQLFVYVLVLLLPVLPTGARDTVALLRSRSFLLSAMPLAVAALVLAIVLWIIRDPQTTGNMARGVALNSKLLDGFANLASFPILWMVSFPLGVAWLALHGRRIAGNPWCWAAMAGGAAFVLLRRAIDGPKSDWHPLLWEAPIAALGTAVLADLVLDAWRRRDRIELALAAWLFLALPVALYPQLVSKHVLPSVPAMALLIVRHARLEPKSSSSTRLGVALGGGGLLLGFLITSADAQFADIGRFAARVAATEKAKGSTVWYDGGLGFAWYARQAEAGPLSLSAPGPAPGDVIVAVAGLEPLQTERNPDAVLVRRFEFDEPGGRVWGRLAGFWYNRHQFGVLPWQWSRTQVARVEVWKVK